MAMLKFGHAAVVEPSIAPEAWTKSVCCGHKGACACGTASCRTKIAKTVVARYSPDRYVLSHCSIMAAVDVENAPTSAGPYKDYLIHPAYSIFVNNNGDAWSKQMLAASYKTFVGANNYLEHMQIAELSKGKVIDAILRDVPVGKDASGKDITTYYVDILVATDRKHADLVRNIEAGITSKLSMGCKIAFSICTKCGKKAVDESEACTHVRYEKGNTFVDPMGVTRKVAELCGHFTDPNSVLFIDASWVANPAFTGAVRRSPVVPTSEIMAKIKAAEVKKAYTPMEGDLLKAASILIRAAEGDKPEEPPVEDTPPTDPEAPAEGTDLAMDKPVDAPADTALDAPAEAPLQEMPAVDDPAAMAREFKKKLKTQMMQQIGDEILKDLSGEGDEGVPGTDSLDDTMISPSASSAVKYAARMKHAWNQWFEKTAAGKMDRKSYDKLRFGSYMLLTSNDLSVLKDYGYNRRDFLAVMSFLDGSMKNPLAPELRKAVASMGGTGGRGPVDTLRWLVTYAGRKITASEAQKAVTWLRFMDKYPSANS